MFRFLHPTQMLASKPSSPNTRHAVKFMCSELSHPSQREKIGVCRGDSDLSHLSESHISIQEIYFKWAPSCTATVARKQVQLWCFTRLQRKITGMVHKQAWRGTSCERLKSTSVSSRNMKKRWCFTLQEWGVETLV